MMRILASPTVMTYSVCSLTDTEAATPIKTTLRNTSNYTYQNYSKQGAQCAEACPHDNSCCMLPHQRYQHYRLTDTAQTPDRGLVPQLHSQCAVTALCKKRHTRRRFETLSHKGGKERGGGGGKRTYHANPRGCNDALSNAHLKCLTPFHSHYNIRASICCQHI